MERSAKYFHPETLSRISRLQLRARHVVEGFVSGMHKSPYKGVQCRVRDESSLLRAG